MIEALIEWAIQYISDISQWLNDSASLVSALATVAIAVLTFQLASENRKLRRAGQEPQVVAYLSTHPDGNGAVNIVFANIGTGPAKNVRFKFDVDEEDFKNHRVKITNEEGRAAVNVIPQGEKISVLFGIGFELFGKVGNEPIDPLKPFKVEIEYCGIDGKKRRMVSEINIGQFLGLAGLTNKPAIREIEKALKNIDKRFDIIAKASHKFVEFVDTTELKDSHRQYKPGGDGNNE